MGNDSPKKPLGQKTLELDAALSGEQPLLNLTGNPGLKTSFPAQNANSGGMIKGGLPQQPSGAPPQHAQQVVQKEAILPEDDIATFFRNRSFVQGGPSAGERFLKGLVVAIVFVAGFVTAYNFQPMVVKSTDRYARKWFGIRLGSYVPAFGPRAASHDSGGKSASNSQLTSVADDRQFDAQWAEIRKAGEMDPLILAVRDGHWKQVETNIAGKCKQWSAARDCLLKGFYYGHRAMTPMARSMGAVSSADIKKLTIVDQSLWYLSRSLLASGGESTVLYKQAWDLAPATARDLRRILVDERVKYLVAHSSMPDADAVVAMMEREVKGPRQESETAKWHALIASKRDISEKSKAIARLLKFDRGDFQNDIASVGMLAPSFIQVGQAEKMTVIARQALTFAGRAGVDPGAQREASEGLIRSLVALGRWSEADTQILQHEKYIGQDLIMTHYRGVLLLRARGSGNFPQAASSFRAANRLQMNWQSLYGLAVAMIRSGQVSHIDSVFAEMGQAGKGADAAYWLTLARGEWNISRGHFKDAENELGPLYSRNPLAITLGNLYMASLEKQGREADAERIRVKLDDVQAKTSYLSSPEAMHSPLGPMALIQ